MEKIIYSLILFFTWIGLNGCYDDKSNYDYVEVTEIKIDTVGMANRTDIYNLEMGKVLTVKPNITYSKDESELNYYWILYDFPYDEVQVGNAMVYPPADTISYVHECNWFVDRAGGYTLQFIAEDPELGLRSFWNFGYITIPEEGVQKGVYLISEYDGMTDIEVFSSDLALILGGEVILPNYYSSLYGEMLPGKPLFISANNQAAGYYYAFTEQGAWRFNRSGLQLMDTFDDMFYIPVNYNPQKYIYANNCEFLINDDKLHVLYLNQTNDRKFSSAIAGDYTAAPFLVQNTRGNNVGSVNADQVIFDTKNNKYRPYFPMAAEISSFNTTSPDAVIDVNNMPGEIFYQLEGSSGEVYNFIDINGEPYLYIVSFYNVPDNGDFAINGTPIISLQGCKDIREAKYFSGSPAGGAFFYATDNAVYSFSYTSGQTTQNDFYTCESGEIVTCLYQHATGGFPVSGSILWVGVWNETEKTGSIIEYSISPITGLPDDGLRASFGGEFKENPRRIDGYGKIKSMVVNPY